MKEAKSEPAWEPTPPSKENETPKERLAVPDAAAQEASLATVREVYRNDYQDRAALAQKLFERAKETHDAVDRFVLLQEAETAAAEAFEGDVAFDIVDTMTDEYNLENWERKAALIERAAKKARLTPEQKTAIAQAALTLMNQAVAEDKFDMARRLGKQASLVIRLAKDQDLFQAITAKNKEIEAAAKAYDQAQEAMVAYKDKPEDPEINLIVGRYLCLSKDQWEKGLPMLALGNDETLKTLADSDLKNPTAAVERVKLGDAWWDAGGKHRAGYWYQKALPGLSGLDKDRVAKRVDSLAPTAAPLAAGAANPAANRPVELLTRTTAKHRVFGEWKKERTGMTCTVPAGADSYARLMLPITVEGSYELAVSFTRISGTDAVAVILPVGTQTGMLMLSHGGGRWHGLEMIDGKGTRANSTTHSPGMLVNGKRHNALVRVQVKDQLAAIDVILDKVSIVQWRGKASSLSLYPSWRLPQSHRIGLGVRESVTFHSVQLKMLSGKADWVR